LRYSKSALGHCVQTLHAQPAPHPPLGEISLAFLTDGALAQLHADFLDDSAPTDVITFPGDLAAGLAGEICVSVDRAAHEARRRARTFASEVTLYIVHGWLHLAGLDDHTPSGRRAMRRGERRLLAALAAAKAMPDFRLIAEKKFHPQKTRKRPKAKSDASR
jgi:probable rRNA maturation factor